ncbi:Protein of unknown function [Yoonia tamlensis]|uniref:DUF1499 domain-containing protein n=1 Tax=Yoonia tamlensis TaxID=390270 RepID=A0A1I6GFF2_9RHOB|nr:DUF1499 domain-containing protein [Yoonia tamlensis]SFR40924.1 Protein of unknown function [Yoonia tamlensis]
MKYIVLFLVLAAACLWVYVRFAPLHMGAIHEQRAQSAPGDVLRAGGFQAARRITAPPAKVLEAASQAVLATPRSRQIAGDIAKGSLTFETRSAFWGFPDYTVIAIQGDLVVIAGHLRYGRSDMGVNKTRILGWLRALAPLTEPL